MTSASAVSFSSAYSQVFREISNGLDDLDAYELEEWFTVPQGPLRESLQRALDERRGKSSIALEDAIDLVQAWFVVDAYRSFGDLVRPLLAEEIERRYVIEEAAIPVAAGATIAASAADADEEGLVAWRHEENRKAPGKIAARDTIERRPVDWNVAIPYLLHEIAGMLRVDVDPTIREQHDLSAAIAQGIADRELAGG